jgi:hypothetical protein
MKRWSPTGGRLANPTAGGFRVEAVTDFDQGGLGLHRFRVSLDGGSGDCFITAGEALRLSKLNTDWVRQALINLDNRYGSAWLEQALRSNPGLLLHHTDAREGRPRGSTDPGSGPAPITDPARSRW